MAKNKTVLVIDDVKTVLQLIRSSLIDHPVDERRLWFPHPSSALRAAAVGKNIVGTAVVAES